MCVTVRAWLLLAAVAALVVALPPAEAAAGSNKNSSEWLYGRSTFYDDNQQVAWWNGQWAGH
jgi:hypothetical protein